ncbi:hypothetical protein BAE30_04170 [Acidithiobacillus caldus]|uniref:Uncharacterized protein n=1 Tax=Acidithiobacillus caldus TaxID=33059 RepID=A0A1E7YZE0_9PROT|nr:hypothetical protein BAE30_04170 [Acidithiobacillus caldus]
MDDTDDPRKKMLWRFFFALALCISLTLSVQQIAGLLESDHPPAHSAPRPTQKARAVAPVARPSAEQIEHGKVIVVHEHIFGSFGFIVLFVILIMILVSVV